MIRRFGRHLAAAAIIVVLGLLAAVWFDGGERALRPINEEVVLPEISQ